MVATTPASRMAHTTSTCAEQLRHSNKRRGNKSSQESKTIHGNKPSGQSELSQHQPSLLTGYYPYA